jgi:hypothetical protein
LSVGLGAVVRAGLAAGPLRFGLGRPLGEGGGLALAGALRLLQLPIQALDLGFELGHTLPQVCDESVAVAAASASGGSHAFIIGKRADLPADVKPAEGSPERARRKSNALSRDPT